MWDWHDAEELKQLLVRQRPGSGMRWVTCKVLFSNPIARLACRRAQHLSYNRAGDIDRNLYEHTGIDSGVDGHKRTGSTSRRRTADAAHASDRGCAGDW